MARTIGAARIKEQCLALIDTLDAEAALAQTLERDNRTSPAPALLSALFRGSQPIPNQPRYLQLVQLDSPSAAVATPYGGERTRQLYPSQRLTGCVEQGPLEARLSAILPSQPQNAVLSQVREADRRLEGWTPNRLANPADHFGGARCPRVPRNGDAPGLGDSGG